MVRVQREEAQSEKERGREIEKLRYKDKAVR